MIAGGVTVLLLLPFIAKAYHIDDPMYLWGAEQILKHPFDFYGFTVNWSLAEGAMAEVTKNPPGISYFIALASLPLAGLYFEVGMHFFFLFPALALTAGKRKMKWWVTEMYERTADTCLQLHGGYGYMTEYPVAKYFVDSRVGTIYGGTTEIMKEIIGRSLGF